MKRSVLKRKGIGGGRVVRIKRKSPLKRKLGGNKGKKRRKKGEITKLKAQLWQLCRQIIKKRYGNICYTCKKEIPDGKGMHTGHYITSSLCSIELRFDLDNLRPQCFHDNINLSGNWPAYKQAIELEMGPDITTKLLQRNQETKGKVYSKEWFEAKIQHYSQLI